MHVNIVLTISDNPRNMPRKRLTTQEFIGRAQQKHDNKYDYSLVDYVSGKTKVIIICPEHGEFLQTPDNHLSGSACPSCSGNLPLTTETFTIKARLKHDNKYAYSLVDYVNSSTKVRIICPEHGEFLQTPDNHLSGKACSSCGGTLPLTTETFTIKARLKHDNKYDYSLVDYVNSKTDVRIICPEHGEFLQTPGAHLRGAACPSCGGNLQLTTETFTIKARLHHGDRYDYSLVDYVNSHTKVRIICPEHGEFLQLPNSHLSGNACPSCSGNLQLTTETFTIKARLKHDNKYDYSLVDYVNSHTKVRIICPEHGEFLQPPHRHLSGNACPACAVTGYDPQKPGTLYYVRFDLPEVTLWKIGITNRSVRERFAGFNVKPVVLWERRWENGFIAQKVEKKIKNGGRYDRHKYAGEPIIESGYTECFTYDIMSLGYTTRVDLCAA